jgi:predicted helicase
LDKYRSQAQSQTTKGDLFEKLMVNFLLTYQVFDRRFAHVWQWVDFPYRHSVGAHDVGIDLVAETVDSEFWAVQCKFYQDNFPVPKAALDGFIATSGRAFMGPKSQTVRFAHRLLIATSNNWSQHAESVTANQDPPFLRISLTDLESAEVDWAKLDAGIFGLKARMEPKTLLAHQKEAVDAFHSYFKERERGKLILPCGTGKTLTALKIAEKETNGSGLVLFLAPSISLIGQTLREWSAETVCHLYPICVCSDASVSKKYSETTDDGYFNKVENLALPASTSAKEIVDLLRRSEPNQLKVIFSTYHSIKAVSEAIKEFKSQFDLVVCDEAHRTTGVTLADEDESHFVAVHNQETIPAKKRLYMTATSRIYGESAKQKAENVSAVLCSMDDPEIYGEEVYHMGFSTAVEKKLLTDYKVLVLTLNQKNIPPKLMELIADGQKEINSDEATKFIGCVFALSKRMEVASGSLLSLDPGPMRKAVAFCQNIKKSRRYSTIFNDYKDFYYQDLSLEIRKGLVDVEADHVDGSMGAARRERLMAWLKSVPNDANKCNILCNVRCLSEGVDVPSLDAVIFLSAKNSKIEVVQSVGRVMRRAEGKNFGYCIIPILVSPLVKPEIALRDHKTYGVVWDVLNALKAHDDRFVAKINQIRFNEIKPEDGGSVIIGQPETSSSAAGQADLGFAKPNEGDLFETLPNMRDYREAIFAKAVEKVGSRGDMPSWAEDVAKVAQSHVVRIGELVKKPGQHQDEFKNFLAGLQKNLNPSVDEVEAVRMLAQHMVTKPVFEALFENYSFAKNNPVSRSLEAMVELLETQSLDKDAESLDKFYDRARNKIASLNEPEIESIDERQIKRFVSGIDNAAARQKIIVDLYDNFFNKAFKDETDKLGIVYTPIELVDFIINSVAKVLNIEFHKDISDYNVHLMDPFTGTGTFITRLIQSGLLAKNLKYKYERELHANEIVLLAYYIASVNIENAYHMAIGEDKEYQSFNGICLTDSFQLHESEDLKIKFAQVFKENSERAEAQKNAPIMVILGNPPYSKGQDDANKNAKNQSYPVLDSRVRVTYAEASKVSNKNALYDSYIRAFRWATDRLNADVGGVIAFVTNASWIDSNAMAGMRKCLAKDFSSIYVFHLRGNQRTSGETSRKEGGKIFGSGSRAPIAITVLIKNPSSPGPAKIYYHDIGDYLTREQKLAQIAQNHDIYNEAMKWETIIPNVEGDWINKRNDLFSGFMSLGDKKDKFNKETVFYPFFSIGLVTSRDAWCYNFSKHHLSYNIIKTINFYEKNRVNLINNNLSLKEADKFIDYDNTNISWSSMLISSISSNKKLEFDETKIIKAIYRPFVVQNIYYDSILIHSINLMPRLFPTKNHENMIICCSIFKDGLPLITNYIADFHFNGDTQCFPRYFYEPVDENQNTVFTQAVDGYVRYDAITDYILKLFQAKYDLKVTKDKIFYYVYGILHSKDYREAFSADLKKMTPRIPLVEKMDDFEAFWQAGQALTNLHLNYEGVKPYSNVKIIGEEKGNFLVDKIRFAAKDDKTVIQFNPFIKITGIPLEAYDYVVNGKSAIEWILDRYQVFVDKKSGLKNDPNDWAKEQNEPRYVLDLLLKVITVSLKTLNIINELPILTDCLLIKNGLNIIK